MRRFKRTPAWVWGRNRASEKMVYIIAAFGQDHANFESKYIGFDKEFAYREAERLAASATDKYVRFYVMKSIGYVIPKHQEVTVSRVEWP